MAEESASIQSLQGEGRVIEPPEWVRERAWISSMDEYDAMYRRSVEDPDRGKRTREDASRSRARLCPVPAGAECPVHLARRHGEPPERGGGDQDPAPGPQDVPEPGAVGHRRGRLREPAPAGEPPGVPGHLRPA